MSQDKLLWRTRGKEIELTADSHWYHGGPGGLQPGTDLQASDRTDRVYITPCLVTAQAYAAAARLHQRLQRYTAKYPYIRRPSGPPHRSGAVYRVAPALPIEPDPASPWLQFRCPNARIVEVVVADLRVDIPLWKIVTKYLIPGYVGRQIEFPKIQ